MALMDTIQREILEERLEQEMEALSQEMYGKRIAEISDKDLYYVILNLTKGMMSATIPTDGKKKVYYISAEFLIGKLLSNNLINLGVYDKVESILKANTDGGTSTDGSGTGAGTFFRKRRSGKACGMLPGFYRHSGASRRGNRPELSFRPFQTGL